jgi:3-phenylpropionate/cinnamic acid dioxygenase small subunit
VTNPAILAQVDELQTRYLDALDRHDMPAWRECFLGEDAGYVCITRENHDAGLPVALMMDDSQARLADRVKFITEVWSGTYEDYSTRHFVQRLRCLEKADNRFFVISNFMVAYTDRRGRSELLVTGVYEDEIAIDAKGPFFKSKRAILDTITTSRYLVYPV